MSNNQKQEIMSKVKVTKNPETGVIVEKGNVGKDGIQYGYIRVETKAFNFGNAVAGSKNKSALKSVRYDDAIAALAAGEIYEGMELPGKIITIESTTQELGMKPKQAGKDGGFCLKDGKQIFFKTEYTEDMELTDSLVKHTSISEPVNANVASKAKIGG